MSKWKKKCGIAIAINSFIASEKHQLSIVTGDYIFVNEGNHSWLLGRNLFTHNVGIFPLSCVSFIEKSDISINSFLSQKSDILIYEAEMTIRYAFVRLSSNPLNLQSNITFSTSNLNLNDPSFIVNIFTLITNVTNQIDICMNHSNASTITAHLSLSEAVDNLRKALGLENQQRSLYSSPTTISTLGRKIDPSNPYINALNLSTKSIDQPIVFHFQIGIKEIIKPFLCSFYLYDAVNKSYLSAPETLKIDQNLTNDDMFIIDLFYERLDKKYMSNNLYLIIYLFETKKIDDKKCTMKHTSKDADKANESNDNEEENEYYSIRKCFSCAILKLPELNFDSFGESIVTEIKSFTIKREKFNILTLPEAISNNLPLFQSILNSNSKAQEEKLNNELSQSDDFEDQNFDNESTENEIKRMPLHKKNNRVNTRKTFNKLPPLVLDSPNMQPSSPYLSPPSSPRSKVSRPTSYANTNISSSASTPNLSMLSSSNHENQYNIDTLLNKLNLKVIRYPLNFTFKITPYSGLVQNIFDEENLQKGHIISPYHITSLSDQNDNKSIINIQLRRLKLDIHHNKYSLVIVRLLDVTQSTFVNCFQSFENAKDFNCESWICPVIKSTIEDQFNDFFSINLNATNLPISSLLLVIEFYKINTGFKDANPTLAGYGFLPLFYQNEKSITPPNNGEITLYNSSKTFTASEIISTFIQDNEKSNKEVIKLIPNPKPIGSILYHFDSNNLIQYANLFKLFHYHEYTNELMSLMNSFMLFGINEWLMNTNKILLNLYSIISSMNNELASEAFRVLQLMLSSLKGRFNDSLESIIENSFDTSKNTEFLIDLQNLADVLLPLIIDKLLNNPEINEKYEDDNHEFRNLVKTLPSFLQIAARSYALKPNSDRKDKVQKIFDLLNQLLKKESSTEQEEAIIFMNQRLLLSHFWKLVDVLPICFDKDFATEVICSFISSIRDDKDSLFAEKVKLLLNLSSKDIFWINNSSKNKLNDIFTEVLGLAATKLNYLDDVYQILTGILYSSNSRFVITFLPTLEQFLDKNRYDRRLIHMLLIIAFNFPESFPLRLLNKLVFPPKKLPQPKVPLDFNEKYPKNLFIVDYEEVLKNSERLFIYIHVISSQKDEIIKKFKYKIFDIFEINNNENLYLDSFTEQMTKSNYILDSNTIKYKLFLDVFNIAISSIKPELSPFDSFFSSSIYNFNNDFSVLPYIFHNFSSNQRLYLPMICPLLHCMILYPSKNLAELFYLILKADIKLNKEPTNVKRETLNALWKISSNKYNKSRSFYNIKKEKIDENSFANILQKDETAPERKKTYKQLYEFNHLCKEKEFVDLASTLFSKESIPKINESKKHKTPKYKKENATKEQIIQIIENFADLYSNIVKSINQIRDYQNEIDLLNKPFPSRDELIVNEDKIAESIRIILKSTIEIKNEKFWRKLIEMLCRLHLICGNQVEAAFSLNHYLDLIPCSNEYIINIKRDTLRLLIETKQENENNNNLSLSMDQNNSINHKLKPALTSKALKKSFYPIAESNQNNGKSNDFTYNSIGGWNSENCQDKSSPFCSINGRELHVCFLLKMIDLCIKSNNESVANQFIDQLQTTCVQKFRIIELMPIICNLRRSIYQSINTHSTPSSNFFRASFYGTKFDNVYRNRTFIYRRDYKLDGLNKFKAELIEKFPAATFNQLPKQIENANNFILLDLDSQKKLLEQINSQFIIIQEAIPTTEDEVIDPFFDSYDLTNYASEISGVSEKTVFRCETPIEQESLYANVQPASQLYLRLGEKHFPTIERRIEIEGQQNSFSRKIEPIIYALISLQRNRNELLRETKRVAPFIEKVRNSKKEEIEKDDSIQINYDSLNSYSNHLSFMMQKNTPNWKCFKDFFIESNNDDSEKVEKLKSLLNEIVELLNSSISSLLNLKVPQSVKKDFKATEQLFKDLKNALEYSQ